MTIIYYFLVSLFRWDIKWIFRLSTMWGITRLILVIFAFLMLIIDSVFIYDKVLHLQRINVQLERIEMCSQIVSNESNKKLNWGIIHKLELSVSEVKNEANIICKRVKTKKLNNAFLDVLGIPSISDMNNAITVILPNGNTISSVPKRATKGQVKEIAIKAGLAQESDFDVHTHLSFNAFMWNKAFSH